MKKSEQIFINEKAKENYDIMSSEFFDNINRHEFIRLRSCNAHVAETERFFVLVSYETPVAFIDKFTGDKFDVLRMVYGYTATSAQHIAKFFHDYSDFAWYEKVFTYREV